jgi:hypothetical protein
VLLSERPGGVVDAEVRRLLGLLDRLIDALHSGFLSAQGNSSHKLLTYERVVALGHPLAALKDQTTFICAVCMLFLLCTATQMNALLSPSKAL